MAKVKLSQCMIVKNEEKNIRKALGWAKNIAYEQIVVDTGSTDATVAIAKELGVKVFEFPWVDDFSAAKNFAIEKAKGDWIAFLDADEYLSDEDASKLISYIEEVEENESAYRKKFQNVPTIIRCSWVHLNDNGEPFSINVQDRIFKNKSYIRYKNKIHEVLNSLDQHELMVVDARDEFKIFHMGYQKHTLDNTGKGERNVALIKEELKNNPDDPNLLFYLADSLYIIKEFQQCEDACYKTIANKEKGLSEIRLIGVYQKLMQVLSQKKEKDTEEKIRKIYKEATTADDGHPDFDMYLGYYLAVIGKWSESVFYLENALTKAETYKSSTTIMIYGELSNLYRCLYIACDMEKDASKLVKYGTLSLCANKYQEDLLVSLIKKFTYDYPTPGNDIVTFLMKIYDFHNKKDGLFALKCAKLAANRELDSIISNIVLPIRE